MLIALIHGLRDSVVGKAERPGRVVQAERFAGLITGQAQPGDGVIACEDFNVLQGSAPLRG